ncbi:hypothetical protein B0H16DRAFT_1734450 [Mycena metata]|uniref:Secreted protein n=1 Tax=Mycena metata TaxID=1033252 RepID=A0AAD7HUV8_9AGAR|nr:hypothetical protein B0H16DRAFT_1734450 [Mycena metata]
MYSRFFLVAALFLAVSAVTRGTDKSARVIFPGASQPEERAYKVFEQGKCVYKQCTTSAQCTTAGCTVCTESACAQAEGRY